MSRSLTRSQQKLLTIFDVGEPWTAPEVADALDLGRRSAYERLQRLVAPGRLETKKVGANARVWWLPSDTSGDDESDHERTDLPAPAPDVQLQTLVDAVEEHAIFLLAADGRVRSWNVGAERIKGYDEAAILGEPVSTFYTEEDRGESVTGVGAQRGRGTLFSGADATASQHRQGDQRRLGGPPDPGVRLHPGSGGRGG